MATLLSINNYYYRRGGAEVVFLAQNELFESMGWKVVPFAMHHKHNIPSPWSRYFVDEIEFGEQYSLLEKLRKIPKTIYSTESQRKLESLIAAEKPDICHIHNIYHHISPSILPVLKRQRIPVVLTLHDLKIACPAYKMLNRSGVCERCKQGRLYNVVTNRCVKDSIALSTVVLLEGVLHRLLKTYEKNVDRFVVPSEFYLEKFVEWGWNRERFVHIPNFVDVVEHQAGDSVGSQFVYFGRLAPEKGVATFIRAAALAGVSALIVGTGPEHEALIGLAKSLGADVKFLGYRSGEQLREVIRAARATVLPSEWYENAPISVLESYALGVPVIGARIGGIPELIREGETGFTFLSGSADELAVVLRKTQEMSCAELAAMGRNARALAESEFTSERYSERLVNLYADLGAVR